ncbi:hypothetical protein LXA43DRAFT_850316, partial [Ganoderma leucocontextum]
TSSTSASSTSASSTSASSTSASSTPTSISEDVDHLAEIRASIQKLAALERDKPMWDAAAKMRGEEGPQREAGAQRKAAKSEGDCRRAEAKVRRAAEEAAAQEARAARVRHLEALAEEERSRRGRMRRSWDALEAVKCYITAGAAFDETKFSLDNPILFEKVPWPTLLPPWRVREEDITWQAVEEFFAKAYARLSAKEYMDMVEKSHKRFHVDRWRARQLMKSVGNKEWEDRLETVVNVASQAVTPIWRASK